MSPLIRTIFGLFLLASTSTARAQNLLTNPTFDGSPTPSAWDQLWMRDPGAATETVELDRPPSILSARSLKIVSTGSRDWSVGQAKPVAVKPGDILELSGWLKGEGDGDVQLSLHTLDVHGSTIDWEAGLISVPGRFGWTHYHRRYVVPAGCVAAQFRLTGDGHDTCELAAPSLVSVGTTSAMLSKWHGRIFTISNPALTVRFNPEHATIALIDGDNHHAWWQTPLSSGMIVKQTTSVSKTKLRCVVWDVVNDLTLTVDIALAAKSPEVAVTIHGKGSVDDHVTFPAPFQTAAGDSLVVPLNEGILYPADDLTVDTFRLPTYMGNSTSMPWTGITSKSGAGVMTVINTPDDADFDLTRSGGLLMAQPLWEASRGQFSYDRKLTYVVLSGGGYVAQAKWYRQYAQRTGLFKTLAEKRKSNPNVDKLIGAANVWNWDGGKVELCSSMKALGLDRVIWSNGGNAEEMAAINKLGYLTSRYDIYQDVWDNAAPDYLHKEGWPEDLVLLKDGDWMKGWAHIVTNPDKTQTTYQGGVINSGRGLARARREIPENLRNTAYNCRFLDTTTASPWREDYSPIHPLTRSQDRANKMALLGLCSQDLKLVTGSETGIDTAVPVVDYFEGMMSLSIYRLDDAGRNMLPPEPATANILKYMVGPKYRIPLWDLVYHDCVVSYWYWGDYNNKIPEIWRQRDLFDILYAEPPMYMFDTATWKRDQDKFVRSYKDVCPVARRFGYDEMLSHTFLTADRTLQESFRWKSGAAIIINLSDRPQRAESVGIPPLSYRIVERGQAHS